MPWRKYVPKKGKYGPIYDIAPGVTVRQNHYGKWTIFLNNNGDRQNKTVGTGKKSLGKAIKAAEAIAAELTEARKQPPQEEKTEKSNHGVLFKKYSNEWVEDNSGRWDYKTQNRYAGMLRLHIWPHKSFKGRRVTEIETKAVKKFLRDLLKTHSPASVGVAHTVLSGVFSEAIDDGLIPSNPASMLLGKVLPPKAKRGLTDPDPFDLEERERFLECAGKTCTWPQKLVLKIMLFMGFRLGEVLAMRLRHLDLVKRLYHVSESYNQHRFGLPKKGKKRLVDIPQFLADELRQYLTHLKKESLKAGNGGEIDLLFVDPQETDYPYSQRKIYELTKRVSKKAGLRVRHPHDLRHTYATTLLMAHKSPNYVMKQMGHSSIAITVDIYSHWIPGKGREGLDEALLWGGASGAKSEQECTSDAHLGNHHP